tara:strand:- start:197 stop:541 length:345 start_codon:yes stop_codon:yes gene_type:complete
MSKLKVSLYATGLLAAMSLGFLVSSIHGRYSTEAWVGKNLDGGFQIAEGYGSNLCLVHNKNVVLPEMHKQQFETVWKLHDRGVYFEVRMRNTSSEVISIYIIDKKTQKIVLIPQ